MSQKLEVAGLNAWFSERQVLQDITMSMPEGAATAIIGPSGCGKSTLIRCLNRMHEVVPGARVEGQVRLDGQCVYGNGIDPVQIRARVGMVFQRPNPFPTLSVFDNVVAGLNLRGKRPPRWELEAIVERSLRQVTLWDEVKDCLGASGTSISGGQQQRLCLARALAIEPEIILMDEPCSALDPISTAKIEALIYELKPRYTIVIVTHNMQQAARVSDFTAFLYLGGLVEHGPTEQIFTTPQTKKTEDYITGRFG